MKETVSREAFMAVYEVAKYLLDFINEGCTTLEDMDLKYIGPRMAKARAAAEKAPVVSSGTVTGVTTTIKPTQIPRYWCRTIMVGGPNFAE